MKVEVTMESVVFHKLHEYLEFHEEEIADNIENFGALRSVFIAFFNRALESPRRTDE